MDWNFSDIFLMLANSASLPRGVRRLKHVLRVFYAVVETWLRSVRTLKASHSTAGAWIQTRQ